MEQTFNLSKITPYSRRWAVNVKKKKKRDCSPVDIRMNCVYNYCVQSVFYASIAFPEIYNQSIPIGTNLSIDWYR